MADDVLGEVGAIDQLVEIEAGLDAHLLAHEDEIFGADIARRALMPGEGTAAETGDRGVVLGHAHLEPGIGIGDAHAARVVEMKHDIEIGEFFAHRGDDALDRARRRPAHRVGERQAA